jgi:DNA-directed RNA polymerase subunit RPC12/RpoP
MIDWLIFRLFVLNMGWKQNSLQIMIFLYICSTCSVFELKTRFETWIERNDVSGVNLFHFSYLITLLVYLRSQLSPLVQIRYIICYWSIYKLVVLNTVWKRDSLQIMIFVYVCSTCSVVKIKTHFETWIKRNDVNGVNLFLLSYLIILVAYLCSQTAPNVQIKSFMFDWSIYRLFVLIWSGNKILSKWWYSYTFAGYGALWN